jgi:diguanylate cyclase (GGDEF)-like protein
MFADWMLIWAAMAGPTGFLIMAVVAGFVWTQKRSVERQLLKEQGEFESSQNIIIGDIHQLQKDNALGRIENRLLHDMLQQSNLQGMIDTVLRAIQPLQQGAFIAFFRVEQKERFLLAAQRGLSTITKNNLTGKSISFLQVKVKEHHANCSLLVQSDLQRLLAPYLTQEEYGRLGQLQGFFMHAGSRPVGVVVTTRLFPTGYEQDVQIESTREVLGSLAVACSYAYEYESHQNELHLSSEILSLRAIMDEDHATPLKMLEAFSTRLMTILNSQRIVLFLAQPDMQLPERPIIDLGIKVHSLGVQKRWQEYERRLVQLVHGQPDAEYFGTRVLLQNDLAELQIESLIGSALVTPIVRERGVLGVLCVTRPESLAFSKQQLELVQWATEFLADTIVKTVNHAVVVRDARYDALTGLYNRRTFEKSLTSEIERATASQQELSMCLVDADHFKKINDHFGHQAGDDVLRFLGRLIRTEVDKFPAEQKPIACRYGGEELAILFPGQGSGVVHGFADQLRQQIEVATIVSEGITVPVTVSIGVGALTEHASDRVGLLKATDEALYVAKKSGRNCVRRAVRADVVVAS